MGIEKKAEHRSITAKWVASEGTELGIDTGLATTGWCRVTKTLIFHKSWIILPICLPCSSNFPPFFTDEMCVLQGDLAGIKTPYSSKEGITGQMPSSDSQASGYWGTAGNTWSFLHLIFTGSAAKSLLTSLEWEAHSLEGTSEGSSKSMELPSDCSPSAVNSVTRWWSRGLVTWNVQIETICGVINCGS